MERDRTLRIENLTFSTNLEDDEKILFRTFGPDSKIRTPFECTNPQFVEIGKFVSINREMRLSVFKDITHHIDYLKEHYPGLERKVKRRDYLFHDPSVTIGDCTSFGRFCFITCTGRIKIGKAVIFSDRVYISDTDHRYEDPDLPILYQSLTKGGAVEIGDHSWIGTGVTVLNCSIGKHCVIGAHSLVTKDIPEYSVAAGTPARVIKRYDFETGQWQGARDSGNVSLKTRTQEKAEKTEPREGSSGRHGMGGASFPGQIQFEGEREEGQPCAE